MNACLIIAIVLISAGFLVAGFIAGRETKRVNRHESNPHRRANRDRVNSPYETEKAIE